MTKKRSRKTAVTFLLLCCCLFLFACSGMTSDDSGNGADPPGDGEAPNLASLDIDYETFQKIVGWLSDDTLLVHLGDTEGHELAAFNIFSGELNPLYRDDSFILSVEINQTRTKIIFQEVGNEQSTLRVITSEGLTLQSIEFGYTSYVNLNWNPIDDTTVFVSHYTFDHVLETEAIEVYIWNTDQNTLTPKDIPSLSPKWYSANIYLYMDEMDTQSLYIGDTREEDADRMLNRDIAGFFLNQDTFIGVVESDIQDSQMHLFHEYPFLVGEQALTIPKVTMNKYPVVPHFTQSTRNGDIYGVIPSYSFALEEELGEFQLAQLDFENETVQELLELPEDAPIALSPNEEYLLYGWRLENIIQLSDPELIPLIAVLR